MYNQCAAALLERPRGGVDEGHKPRAPECNNVVEQMKVLLQEEDFAVMGGEDCVKRMLQLVNNPGGSDSEVPAAEVPKALVTCSVCCKPTTVLGLSGKGACMICNATSGAGLSVLELCFVMSSKGCIQEATGAESLCTTWLLY